MANDIDIQSHAILSAAASAEHGLLLTTNDPIRARQQLYRYRKAVGDVAFADIAIRTSPDNPETELWLLRSVKVTMTFTMSDIETI